MAVKAKAEITLIRVNDGQNGVGIKSAVVTYQAGASQTTAPTGSWTTSIPKLSTATPYLWTKTVVTYTDGKISTSYSISSTLDGVEVGGRNYVLKSHKLYATNDWSDWFTPSKEINSCGLRGGMFYFPDDAKIGDSFTVSFDLEWTKFTALSGQKFWANIQWYANGSWDFDYGSPFEVFPIGWKYNEFLSDPGTRRYSIKATLKNQKQIDAGWNMNLRFDYSDGTGKVRIRRMKIERGNKATDWTPAPEDISDDIGNAQNSADNANDLANNALKGVTNVSSTLEVHENKVEARFENMVEYVDGRTDVITNWIRQGSTGTTPYLELGGTGSSFNARLTNSRLGFYEGANELAYFGNEKMHISDADIDKATIDSLIVGEYEIASKNGHFSIIYVGK